MSSEQSQFLKRWYQLCVAAMLLAFLVVGLGAFTRLVDAGLGCPDWPGCYGHLMWPDSAEEKQLAEQAFPESPVDTDKTWPEMVHRYFAGTLGLLVLAIAVMAVKARSTLPKAPLKLPLILLLLVIVQAAFGMWTVTLKLLPQVVTAHLLGGFATLSFIGLMILRLRRYRALAGKGAIKREAKAVDPMGLATSLLIVVLLQIALGGWTSSNYAALICPDLPTCQNQWWPQADFSEGFNFSHKIGPNYEGGVLDAPARTAIHLSHRIGAVLVTLLGLLLIFRLAQAGYARLWPILSAALAVQVILGLSNIWFALPLAIAVAHNIGGAVLLLVLIKINFDLSLPQPDNRSVI